MLGVFMPNVLKKIPELFEEITNYPEDPPAWLTKDKFENAGPFHAFAPERLVDNSRLKEQIDHVADWVVGACRRDAPWLKDTDARGYPKKFGKIGTLQAAVDCADKDMRRRQPKQTETFENLCATGHLEIIETMGNLTWVRLLSLTALQLESGMMQHCIGHGAYDDKLFKPDVFFYSLRDQFGKAHVTIYVDGDAVLQCKGKQNNPPLPKYMDAVQQFIRSRGWRINEEACYCNLIECDGVVYSIFELPENLKVGGYLNLEDCNNLIALPKGLTVGGYLSLGGCTNLVSLPEGLTVGGYLDLERCTNLVSLPEGLTVGGDIFLSECTNLVSLPEGLTVGGNLDLWGCTRLSQLPKDMNVKGIIDTEFGVFRSVDALREAFEQQQAPQPIRSLSPEHLSKAGGSLVY